MNTKTLLAFFAAAMLIGAPLRGASYDASELPTGRYTATLSPAVGRSTARQVTEELKKIQELDTIKIDEPGFVIHFTVRDNMRVKISWLNEAIQRVAPGVTLTAWTVDSTSTMSAPIPRNPKPPEKSGVPADW